MKRFLVKIRQLCTRIVRVLSEQELLLIAVSLLLMFLLGIAICLILLSIFYDFALFFLAIVILLFVWVGWALIGIVQDEEDFYF